MAQEQDLNIEITEVGDRYVLEKMLDEDYNLGGEQSGHIIFLDHSHTGDGILTAVQLACACKCKGLALSEMNTKMTALPQVLENAIVPNEKKEAVLKDKTVIEAKIALVQKFEDRGRVLIRPSGTEPKVRITIEGADIEEIQREAVLFKNLLEKTAAAL